MIHNNNQKGAGATGGIITVLIIILIILGSIYYLNLSNNQGDEPTTIDTTNWQTYASEQYNFSIRYPQDWEIAVGTLIIDPAISIYKPNSSTSTPPFNHFIDATHVSVYPHGIATEGEVGQTATSSIATSYDTDSLYDFTLNNDLPWATYLNPAKEPASWNQSGFIWAKVSLEDVFTRCLNTDNEAVALNQCLEIPKNNNLELIHQGEINKHDRAIQEEIIKSFQWEAAQAPISITTPKANQTITSPLEITGQARGTWYFEAVFPIELQDMNGNVIARTNAQATENWMTENFVPFTATLTFTSPTTANGLLVVKKDNPSGLPQNDAMITVPIKF